MPKVILNQILNQLETLELSELRQLNQAIQNYLVSLEASTQKTKFHQALLTSGLVKQIKQSPVIAQLSRPLIQAQGQAVSETIISERR